MALLEDVVLTDSIEINTTPEEVFSFLTGLVDDESYRAWHQEDHVTLRWLEGQPWTKGSIVYAEEYIHGKLHKLKFKVTEVVPNIDENIALLCEEILNTQEEKRAVVFSQLTPLIELY